MLRVLGRRAALPVFGLDMLKGFVAVTIIDLMKYDSVFAGGANENWFLRPALRGRLRRRAGPHIPRFRRLPRRQGVATLWGPSLGGQRPAGAALLRRVVLVLMTTHYVSLSSMTAGCCFPIFTLISPKVNHVWPFVAFSFVIAALLIYTHRKNIERLRAGTESRSTSGGRAVSTLRAANRQRAQATRSSRRPRRRAALTCPPERAVRGAAEEKPPKRIAGRQETGRKMAPPPAVSRSRHPAPPGARPGPAGTPAKRRPRVVHRADTHPSVPEHRPTPNHHAPCYRRI